MPRGGASPRGQRTQVLGGRAGSRERAERAPAPGEDPVPALPPADARPLGSCLRTPLWSAGIPRRPRGSPDPTVSEPSSFSLPRTLSPTRLSPSSPFLPPVPPAQA